MVQGAQKTIVSDKPALLIEIKRRHVNYSSSSATFSWLDAQGYSSFHSMQGSSVLSMSLTLIVQCLGNLGMNNLKYINNFLFLHATCLGRLWKTLAI